MWTFALFGLSLLGMLTLLLGKRCELRYGTMPGLELRRALDARVAAFTAWLRALPARARAVGHDYAAHAIVRTSALLLRFVHFLEGKLIRVINLVKGRGDSSPQQKPASAFLQRVATFKSEGNGTAPEEPAHAEPESERTRLL